MALLLDGEGGGGEGHDGADGLEAQRQPPVEALARELHHGGRVHQGAGARAQCVLPPEAPDRRQPLQSRPPLSGVPVRCRLRRVGARTLSVASQRARVPDTAQTLIISMHVGGALGCPMRLGTGPHMHGHGVVGAFGGALDAVHYTGVGGWCDDGQDALEALQPPHEPPVATCVCMHVQQLDVCAGTLEYSAVCRRSRRRG